jgi:hypothetical protein
MKSNLADDNNQPGTQHGISKQKFGNDHHRNHQKTENREPRTENREPRTDLKAITPWITYRTRFLVKARQLTTGLNFTDALGRQQCGRKGDYLVESTEGILSIVPRQIFEDIYVPLLANETGPDEASTHSAPLPQYRPTPCQEVPRPREIPTLPLPPHLTRKSPQPYRDRRASIPGLRSL